MVTSIDCPHFHVDNLSLSYGELRVVDKLSFSLEEGEIGCLLGPSGCGKSSVLRAIAGFLPPDNGEIWLNQSKLSSPTAMTPTEQRNMGMVYQDYALFPHINVSKNIAFGIRHLPKAEQQQRVEELLSLVQLADKANAFPQDISGGQQQRVALARAMAPKPNLILLDEAFSGLDAELAQILCERVRHILKQTNSTALLVTHNQEEAFRFADKIGLIHNHQLQQWGTAQQLYQTPKNAMVASFIGQGAFLKAQRQQHQLLTAFGAVNIPESLTETQQQLLHTQLQTGDHIELFIRPEDIIVSSITSSITSPAIATCNQDASLSIIERKFLGRHQLLSVQASNGEIIECTIEANILSDTDANIQLQLQPKQFNIF